MSLKGAVWVQGYPANPKVVERESFLTFDYQAQSIK